MHRGKCGNDSIMKVQANCSFAEFCSNIKKENLSIICYGAGLVALSIEDIFIDAGLLDHVKYFIDKDKKKHNEVLCLGAKEINVYGIEKLLSTNMTKCALLITAEVFGAIINELNSYSQLNDVQCYIFPLLNRDYTQNTPKTDIPCVGQPKIPQIIHYCWLGKNDIPKSMLDCINSGRIKIPNMKLCNGMKTIMMYTGTSICGSLMMQKSMRLPQTL
jgi:mannosyltransferase OCH1-like enzyme